MIQRQDILDRAAEWNLRADVVEKDYVLGWLLAGLGLTPATCEAWIFKGGTCIKKCYVETYRFSEDLDFSLLPEAPYTADEISAALEQATRTSSELSGIDFPRDLIEVRPRQNQQGESTFQGRIAYRGPLAIPTFPRVLIDITRHEAVLDAPTPRRPFHGYPDDDQFPDVTVLTYSLHELLAEKTRALYERTRPRDLCVQPRAADRSRAGGFGPTYIFECPDCQKRFRRSTNDADLRKHKTKDGWDCPGRYGQWVDTQY